MNLAKAAIYATIPFGVFSLGACTAPVQPPPPKPTACFWGDSVFAMSADDFQAVMGDAYNIVVTAKVGYGLSELSSYYEPAITAVYATTHCDVNVTDLGNNDLDPADPVQADPPSYINRFITDLGPAPLVWVTPPSTGPWEPDRIAAFDTDVRDAMSGHAGTVVQASTLGIEYGSDHVHPDDAGQRTLANAVDGLVNDLLSPPSP